MVESSPETELPSSETAPLITAMFETPTGNDLAVEASPTTVPTSDTGAGVGGAGAGAARTWHPRLREMAMTLENFMMMVDSGYWELIG
jgi:hypothetical protein